MKAVCIQTILDRGHEVAQPHAVGLSQDALEGLPDGCIVGQQGDSYFAKLSAVPSTVYPWPFTHGQLAPGSTQGSRHTVDLTTVGLWVLQTPTALQGPIIDAPAGCTIAHPEHGHLTFPPGVYQVTYQRAYATEIRRIED